MTKLIEVVKLTYEIPYQKLILEDITFDVMAGEFLGILGINGAGKSTLLNLLMGIRPHKHGQIKILDENPMSDDRKRLSEIVFISQENEFKQGLEIDQVLELYCALYPNYSKEEEVKLLSFFGLARSQKMGSLSTGEKKKVQIVAALCCLPKLLIVDEVTAVLDPETRFKFFTALREAQKKHQLSIVLATNIAEDLCHTADKVLFIKNTSAEIYPPQEVLNLFNIKRAS